MKEFKALGFLSVLLQICGWGSCLLFAAAGLIGLFFLGIYAIPFLNPKIGLYTYQAKKEIFSSSLFL